MTLEKFRRKLSPLTRSIGEVLAKLLPHPNVYTLGGLALAWLTPISSYFGHHFLAIIIIIISSIIDALDGAVARVTGKVTRMGEFLDSVSDRLSDTAYFLALAIAGINSSIVILSLGLSISISYVRAKGELVGVKMRGVGIMERGDRIIWIILVYLLLAIGQENISILTMYFGVILLALTLAFRIIKVVEELRRLP